MSNAMYYVAVLAPGAINEQVLIWKHFMRDRFGCISALKSPAHITLVSPFWMTTDLQSVLENTIKEFSNTQNGFSVELQNFDRFEPGVLFVDVLKSDSLNSLKDDFEQYLLATTLFPLKIPSQPFHAHITIANRDLNKTDFIEAWEHFKNKTYKTSFRANGLTLMKHNSISWEPTYTAPFPSI